MRRFIVKQNIVKFEQALKGDMDHDARASIEKLLAQAREELTWMESIWSRTCPNLFICNALRKDAQELLFRAARIHQADFASLQLWDPIRRSLRLIAHLNFDRSSVEQFASLEDGAGTICEAAQGLRRSVIVGDIETDETFASLRAWTRTLGIRAMRTTPVFDDSANFVGAFSIYYANPHLFSSDEDGIYATNAADFGRLFRNMLK